MAEKPVAGPEYFKHETALVESPSIGKGTRIWAYAHVLPGAVIGADCNICDHTFIENEVSVGDRVTIKCGGQLWDGVTIEDDVFIGPNDFSLCSCWRILDNWRRTADSVDCDGRQAIDEARG